MPENAVADLDVAEIAASSFALPRRAEQMLTVLRRLVPFDGAWLALADPHHPRYTTAAAADLADSTLTFFTSPQQARDIEATGTDRALPPLSPSDLPFPAEELPGWAECLIPAGYREGLAVALFGPGGRHVGFLATLSGGSATPAPEVRRTLARLAPVVARGVDPVRSLATTTRLVRNAHAGVVVAADGSAAPLPGWTTARYSPPGPRLWRPHARSSPPAESTTPSCRRSEAATPPRAPAHPPSWPHRPTCRSTSPRWSSRPWPTTCTGSARGRSRSRASLPAGFRGGVAGALFASTGRHVGFLSLLAEDPDRPSRADRQVLAAVTRVIADHLDRTQEIAALARIVGTAEAGVVLTRGGDTLPLPGLPDDRLLAPASPILDAARDELSAGGPYTAFLAPVTGPAGGGLVRVTALDCAVPDLDHLSAAVLLSSPGDLRGLTPLDLRALGTWWPVRRRSPRSPRHSPSTRAPRPRPSAAPRSPWTPPASPPLPRGRSAR